MAKRTGIVFITVFIVLVFCAALNFASSIENTLPQQNHVPVVKIITPKNNILFDRNTLINYSITVSDKEDGESKYEEINTKEVLLQVKFLGNQTKIPATLSKGVQNDPPGLAAMRTSNCFNCHGFNTKAIGPSFYDINKKYPATRDNIALLVKHTREGSTGVWSKAAMPTHSELTQQETQSIIQWILKNAADPTTTYYTGTEGNFRIQTTVGEQQKGNYLLTASYTDHGINDDSTHRLKGQDVIIIHINK